MIYNGNTRKWEYKTSPSIFGICQIESLFLAPALQPNSFETVQASQKPTGSSTIISLVWIEKETNIKMHGKQTVNTWHNMDDINNKIKKWKQNDGLFHKSGNNDETDWQQTWFQRHTNEAK